ncbi:MAG: hypothetical protein FWG29_08485 [Treponema sp.]|nr:hypothetical protein [Treponema sp.]
MKHRLKYTFALAFVLLPVFTLTALDMGLMLDQGGSYDQSEEVQYSGMLIPWFSALLGKASDLYISAGVTAKYEIREWQIIPELLRTELTLRMEENGELKIGRMAYSDPLGFVASGLFDGVRYVRDLNNGSMIGIGAWYTGLLYKKNAYITMTEDDLVKYNTLVEYADFSDTYFAPRRVIGALDWEHPGLGEFIRLNLALVGQYDLSGKESLYHTQYLIAKAAMPINNFIFELGGCAELIENAEKLQVSFAGEFGIGWYLPTKIYDRLSFLGRFSGGTFNDTFVAFNPITTESHGGVLKAKLRGLSMLRLDYTARLHQTFSIGLQSSYFILSDLDPDSFGGPPGGKDGYFLGNEFYGLMVWSPVSDIQVKIGGGAFLPSLGDADKDADMQWVVSVSIVLALF